MIRLVVRGHLRRVLAVLAVLVGSALLAACGQHSASSGVSLSVFHLKPGNCVDTPGTIKAELTNLQVVSCRQPHTEEVYALVDDPAGDTYPGTTALQSFANSACLQQFQGYVGSDYRDSSLFYTYLLPSVRSWAAGDRKVDCVITTTGQKLTKSVKGTGM